MSHAITIKGFGQLCSVGICLVNSGEEDKPLTFCSCCLSVRPEIYRVSGSRHLCTECFTKEVQNNDTSLEGSIAKAVKCLVTWEDVQDLLGKCPNDGCNKTLRLCDTKVHLERCLFRRVPCTLCGEVISASELIHHSQLLCRKRSVMCQICSLVIFAEEKQAHNLCCSSCKGSVKNTRDRTKKSVEKPSTDVEEEIQTLKTELLVVIRKLSALEQEQTKHWSLLAASLRRPPVAYTWCIESYRKFKAEAMRSKEGVASEPFYFGIAGCKFRLHTNIMSLANGQGEYLGVYVHFKVTDVERFDDFDYPPMKCVVQIASRTRTAEPASLSFVFSTNGHDERRNPGRARYMWNTVQGRAKFIKLAELENEAQGYISHDVLLIEFQVRD